MHISPPDVDTHPCSPVVSGTSQKSVGFSYVEAVNIYRLLVVLILFVFLQFCLPNILHKYCPRSVPSSQPVVCAFDDLNCLSVRLHDLQFGERK